MDSGVLKKRTRVKRRGIGRNDVDEEGERGHKTEIRTEAKERGNVKE